MNGARVTNNNFMINGVDENSMGTNSAPSLAVPAPESLREFKVQTSLYDASFGRSGGGNIQAITKSGSNQFHGDVRLERFGELPGPSTSNRFAKLALSHWQIGGIVTAMSGLPIDIVDTGALRVVRWQRGACAAELRRRQRDVKRAGRLLLQPFRVCAARCARGAADPELGRHGPGGSDWHRYRQLRPQRAPRAEANHLRFFARQTFPGLGKCTNLGLFDAENDFAKDPGLMILPMFGSEAAAGAGYRVHRFTWFSRLNVSARNSMLRLKFTF